MKQYDIESQNEITKQLYHAREKTLSHLSIVEYIDHPSALKDAVERIDLMESVGDELKKETARIQSEQDQMNAAVDEFAIQIKDIMEGV